MSSRRNGIASGSEGRKTLSSRGAGQPEPGPGWLRLAPHHFAARLPLSFYSVRSRRMKSIVDHIGYHGESGAAVTAPSHVIS
jgi:hypothetical protein